MTDPSSINEQKAISSLKDQTSEPVEDKNISSVNNKVDKLKSNPFVSSLKDRMTQLDRYITKIWNSFTSMVLTINNYVKYFEVYIN